MDKKIEDIKKIFADTFEQMNDIDYIKYFGPSEILYMLSGEYAGLAVEYLSEHPESLKQVKKMFEHHYFYGREGVEDLTEAANSGKLDSLFDAKQLLESKDALSLEKKLSDDWSNTSQLAELLKNNEAEVLNILVQDSNTAEKSIIKNVIATMYNDLHNICNNKDEIRKLQPVLDVEEIILEAYAKFGKNTSYDSPELDYKVYLEKKDDIKKILESKDLDLQLMEFCFSVNTPATISLLRSSEEIRKNAERLFVDCADYISQRNLVSKLESFNIRTFRPLLEQNAEKLKTMSGLEVFEIMNKTSVPTNHNLSMLIDVMNLYYRQTYDLSMRSPTSYLYYCSIGSESYWSKYKLGMLDYVGKYAKTPVLEEIMEEKLGRTYAHYSYHENAEFNSVRPEGIDEFEKRLYEAIKKDINSLESKFYLKYAQDVFALKDYGKKYFALTAYLMENHFEQDLNLCKSFIKGMGMLKDWQIDKEIVNDMIQTFSESPDSDKSKIYLENLSKMFVRKMTDGKLFVPNYSSVLTKILNELHDTQPQICEKLCKDAVNIIGPEIAIKLYCIYPSQELVPAIEKYADNILRSEPEEIKELTVVDLYEKSVQTKLPILGKAVDHMLSVKDIRFKNEQKEGIDYGNLIEKIKKANLESINLYDEAAWMIKAGIFKDNNSLMSVIVNHTELDCAELSGCTKLETVFTYRGKFLNPQELLKLPELKSISGTIERKDAQSFVDTLLAEKPRKLTTIDLSTEADILGTSEERIALMEKYPNLVLKIDVGNKNECALKNINETVRNCKNYKEAAEKKVLAEYLQAMPEKPKSDEFMLSPVETDNGNNVYRDVFVILEKQVKKEKYADTLIKIAESCGFEDIKKEAELLKKVDDGTLLSHVEKADKKEMAEALIKPLKSFGYRKTFIDYLQKNIKDKEEFNAMASKIFTCLGFKPEDVEKLGNENLKETIALLNQKRESEQKHAATRAAFERWKQNQMEKK